MGAGATYSVHVSAMSNTTNGNCPNGTTINNTAQVTSNAPTAQSSASVQITCLQTPSVSIVKTADNASVTAGSQIGFKITVTSNGPAAATNVAMNDT